MDLTLSPTLAFTPGRGLRVGVSVDGENPQVIDLALPVGDGKEQWARAVVEGVRKVVTTHTFADAGTHTIKV